MRKLLFVGAFLSLAGVMPGAARVKTPAGDIWFRVSAPAKAKDRAGYRDADWKKLSRLLASDVVLESEKRKWTIEFLVAYWRSPGIEREMARHLVQHVPKCKMRDALKALARGRRPAASPSGEMPGFADGPRDVIQPITSPQKQDPLEALLIAKAREYDAKRAEVQQKQLASLQGDSQEDPAQIRRELAELAPLQNDFCKLSGEYAEKFGGLALKGVLQRERLLGPLDAAQCP